MLLLAVLSFLPIFSALQISSCIVYETYLTTQYKRAPLDFSDAWFRNSFRFSPRKVTKIGLRSKRLIGCCDSGYQYQAFPKYRCQPICFGGCPLNSYCSKPNQCSCDYGYYKSFDGGLCLSNDTLESNKLLTTTTDVSIDTTSSKIPCNGSCSRNEVCSTANDVCICEKGFHHLNDTLGCVPKCEGGCQNGDCISPNTCVCWPHYEQTNESFCHLKCTELSCIFGECNKNGTCICAEGFFNNGTSCLWAGDDIFSEPDDCECWSKFIWQTNVTESRCMHSCDDDDIPKELTSDCIPIRECEFYEGYTICHTQIYKCNNMEALSTTIIPYIVDKFKDDITHKSTKIVFPISACLILVIAVCVSLWIWKMRPNWLSRLRRYNPMGNTQEEEEQVQNML